MTTLRLRTAKIALFALALLPLGALLRDAATGNLSAEPIEQITLLTGEWALRFLLFTLAVTPLRRISGWHWLIRFRRMLGLFAFFYASLHFLTYIVLDQFFGWSMIIEDIVKRGYILVGFATFCLLIPLAVTSTNGMMRRLGGKRWQRLHRLVYVAAVTAVIHFLWLVKADLGEPLYYALALALLLGYRIYASVRGRRPAPQGARPTSPGQGGVSRPRTASG